MNRVFGTFGGVGERAMVRRVVAGAVAAGVVVGGIAGRAIAGFGAGAGAGVGPEAGADKAGYHLFNPTPRGLMREMSTDRPDTTESAYTVDAGHVQIEMSLVDLTFDRRNAESATRRAMAVAPMLVKVGVLNKVDVQIGIDPYVREEVRDRGTGVRETVEGFGDVVVRVKVNLWGNDASGGGEEWWAGGWEGTAFALMPFVKFPTASDRVGNDEFEGGLIAPLAVALPEGFSLGLMAEIDVNRSGDDKRYVLDFVHTATIAHELIGDLSGYLEYAGFANLNGDEDYRGYFDAGLTLAVTEDLQLDAGVRMGLTEAAEDLGVFAGISRRF